LSSRPALGGRRRARQYAAAVKRFLKRGRRRTSVTDEAAYLGICARAATDPAVFARFKREPAYTAVLEHATCEQGAEYLDIALAQTPELADRLHLLRRNDALGSPNVCEYSRHGTFSPTTLRYAKVASDLFQLFGSLDGLRIIEIGAGYGGQAFVLHSLARPASYSIVDLEPCLALQRRYLGELGIDDVELVPPESLSNAGDYDVVISNYAFSECVREVQVTYIERIISRSARGYLTCNWFAPESFRALSPEELLAAVPGSHFLPEEPLTAPLNRIWVWGDRDDRTESNNPSS